jgi:phosphate starvation-inducible PhoH-like protein
VVVTGDVTQIDLPKDLPSGLVHAVDLLERVEGLSIVRFTPADVVRHELVQRILTAYERADHDVRAKPRPRG